MKLFINSYAIVTILAASWGVVSISSCSKGTDLEPAVSQRVDLWNQIGSTITLDFIFQGDTTTISLFDNERRQVGVFVSPPPSISGELNGLPYSNFTDAILTVNGNSQFFEESNCVNEINPLCVDNYERIQDTIINQRRNVIDLLIFE